MFYEVKILNARGNLRKTISSSELSKRYWKTVAQKMSLPGNMKPSRKSRGGDTINKGRRKKENLS